MKKLAVFFALAGCFWSFNAQAQTSADLKAIEDYLNNIKTLEADFVQTASNGNTTEGRLFIAKPNKIRMEYAAPTNVLIVGNGDYIVYNDKDLDQVSNIDYDDIPATLILGNDIKIDGKTIKVASFYKDAGTTIIGLDYKGKGDLGTITLTFNNSPFELRQWKIVDPQSVEISVSLYGTKTDKPIDPSLFKFRKKQNPLKNKGR